jgi:glutamate carboxypeptidase
VAPGELLILGDLDAALVLDEEDCRLTIRGGQAIGPAVADMKGGLVVLVEALGNLARSRLPTPSITVVLSADEQAGSLRSAATISQRADAATWCICLECARDGGRLMRSRGHIGIGRLTATGVEAHAGSAREAGINAVSLLARGILSLDELSGQEATVTPTILTGGRRRSLVPAEATAVLDVRARDAAAWSVLVDHMRAALEPGLDLSLFNHRPGLPATDRTEWFLGLVREVGDPLGLEIDAMDSLAAGSSAFVDSTRIPVLDGMGPAGGGLMTEGEYVEVESLSSRSTLLAATIQRLGS